MWKSLVRAVVGDYLDAQGLYRSGSTPLCCGALENWHYLSGIVALGRMGPVPFPGSTIDLALEAGVQQAPRA